MLNIIIICKSLTNTLSCDGVYFPLLLPVPFIVGPSLLCAYSCGACIIILFVIVASVLQALVVQEKNENSFVPGMAWRSHSKYISNADSSQRGFDPKTKRCATIRTHKFKS